MSSSLPPPVSTTPTIPHSSAADTPETQNKEAEVQVEPPPVFRHSWRIWCIFLVLCLLSFISAVDATIITTSLPTIAREIGGGEQYIWIANSFLFATTAPQPFFGQIATIFGRRIPILVAISLFALGSGISGGANSTGMLIAGRTIQGLGCGGLYVLSDIIICDLVPSRHRGPYLSAVLSSAAIGTTIGPVIGGALAQTQWRWIFWLNLPISGVAFFAILLFLKVRYKRSPTWGRALMRVDFLGNAIFIPSMIAIFFGLIMGGTNYPWNSWRIIVPLVLGVLGWVAFHIHQASPVCKEPSVPARLFHHRTSVTGFIIIFLCSIILQAISYFLPVYFQAVKGTSPLTSGVYFLPFALAIIPFGGLTGVFISKTGLYVPLHWLGFIMNAVGAGLFSILNASSSSAAWIGFQIIASGGVGIIFTTTLPSTLAALAESDVAVATGTYSFVRSFGLVWGVTVASIVFNGQMNANLPSIGNAEIRALLKDGAAYAYASGGFIPSLPLGTRNEVIDVYTKALQVVWQVIAGVSCLGFCFVFLEKHVELRKDLHTEFGLEEEKKVGAPNMLEQGLDQTTGEKK
ncbi:hypothetical protein FQN57_000553 [Myotisia sp. PD_48]|nr:hypothetical protein FQN57_000553 [Myotisia sp. PD_48]